MKHEWYGTSFVSSICLNCGRSGPGPIDDCPGLPPAVDLDHTSNVAERSDEELAAAKKRLRIDRYRICAAIDAITDVEIDRLIRRQKSNRQPESN
ncbi:hypothetical protein ACRARG_12485 [Pseudooceanicola sp. C21-150M6]|uniref:hypothetical protein n=1 Tax=Pseudooceanicola sp. C21-150M6 TaxID=3434355 RepID=UPI003D7FC2F5